MTELDGRMDRFKNLVFASVLFSTLIACLQPLYDAITPNIFTDRDLARAEGLSRTVSQWLGPELSNSAMNTGPFSYLITALTLFLGGTNGYFWALVVFFALGLTILFMNLKRSESASFAAVIVGLIGASPIVFTNIRMAWNPSLLPLFWVFIYLAITRPLHSAALGVFIGLTTQIHILSAIWLPIALFSQTKNRWKSNMWLFLGFIIPQVPAVFRVSQHDHIISQTALSRVFDFSSWLDPLRIQNMSVNLIEFLGLPILTVVGIAIAKKKTSSELRSLAFLFSVFLVSLLFAQRSLEKRVQLHYLAPALLLLVFMIKINWKSDTVRKPIFYGAFALLAGSTFIWQAMTSQGFQIPWIGFAATFFGSLVLFRSDLKELIPPYLAATLTIALFVQMHSNDVIRDSRFVALFHAKAITKAVSKHTGWNKSEFERNSLVYLRWPENSLLATYPDADSTSLKDYQVIILDSRLEPAILRFPSFWTKWIQEERLQLEAKEVVGPYMVRIYRKHDTNLPSALHNIQIPENKSILNPDLRGRFEATFESRILGELALGIEIYNSMIRLTSPLLSRYQTKGPQMQIVDAVLSYTCGGKTRTLEIPKTGMPPFRPPGLRNPFAYVRAGMADYILTPVDWELDGCTDPIVPKSIDVRLAHLQIWDETNSENTKELISNLSAVFLPVPSLDHK